MLRYRSAPEAPLIIREDAVFAGVPAWTLAK